MPKQTKSGSSTSKRGYSGKSKQPARRTTSFIKYRIPSYKKVFGFEDNAESLVIKDFTWDRLPNDYKVALRKILEMLHVNRVFKDIYAYRESTISTEEKEQLLKFFDVENEPKENKQAFMFMPTKFLMNYKFNPYRPDGVEYYIKKFKNWKRKTEKLDLPWLDVYPHKNKISVGEGNHRIKALDELGFNFVPVKVTYM